MRVFILFCLSLGFTSGYAGERLPKRVILDKFLSEFDSFNTSIQNLNESCSGLESFNSEIERTFFEGRIAYKKIEFMLAYLDHEFIGDFINGAPLKRTERKAPNLVIIDPAGLQTAEEKLDEKDFKVFKKLIREMKYKIDFFAPRLKTLRLSDRMIFESLREGVIRLIALGITGFDAPTQKNTMKECQTSLSTLEDYFFVYKNYLNEDHKHEFAKLFQKGREYLAVENIEKLNQYQLIKTVLNPLYGDFLSIQDSLFIEQRDMVYDTEFSVNYKTKSLFQTNFLNAGYFSKYTSAGDRKKREELGELLFFDPILSKNNERACASCHTPDKAFTDGNKTSLAFNGNGVLKRNSPTLINSVFNTRLFWDARATAPEEQVEHVVFNKHEFNTNYEEIIEKLRSSEEYVSLFEAAYPKNKTISSYTMIASISAYVQSLVSWESEFDKSMANRSSLSSEDKNRMENGFNVFAGKGACATCHFIPTFSGNVPPHYTDTETEVLGIPDVNDQSKAQLDEDLGRFANGRPRDGADFYKHSFKTPTLRNIAVTAPYMHNGVFNTLEEVVDYYDIGGGHGWGIAPENTTLPEDSLHLTDGEKADLIFFMKQLTDYEKFKAPTSLPNVSEAALNLRKVGGVY